MDAQLVQKHWADAQTKPEWATTRFWEYIFNKGPFADGRWTVSSQHPPTDEEGDLRRIDLVVERKDDNDGSATLLFMEAKRANVSINQIDQVEYQAFTACCANLFATKRPAIWAMTCVGTMARLWAYKNGADYLTPFVPPGNDLSDKSAYLDYPNREREILEALDFVKRNPVPSKEIFKHSPSPRPTHTNLPRDWHDTEVALVAGLPGSHENVGASEISDELYQTTIYNAAECTELVVKELRGQEYQCVLPDKREMLTSKKRWILCGILVGDQTYQGYSYKGKSGKQYYTWSLEAGGQ